MPTYKVTWIFNQHKQGWTETFYRTASNYTDAKNFALAHVPTRLGLCGRGVTIEAIRISDVDILGDGCLEVNPPNQGPYPADADNPWCAALVGLCAGDRLYRRSLWLRGIPDSWMARDAVTGDCGFPTVMKSRVDALINHLKISNWKLKVIKKTGAGTAPATITNISDNPATGRIVFTTTLAGLTVGDTVRVTDFSGPDKKKLNKTWKIMSITGTDIEVDGKFADLEDATLDAGGKMKRRIIDYVDVEEGSLLRCMWKKTGRAFFVPAGRRRVSR